MGEEVVVVLGWSLVVVVDFVVDIVVDFVVTCAAVLWEYTAAAEVDVVVVALQEVGCS